MAITRRGALGAAAVLAVSALALTGCGGSDSLNSNPGGDSKSSGGSDASSIVIGSANFPENVILANVYGGALEKAGVKVSYKLNIGARAAYIPALQNGEVNLIPEYAGSILSFLDKSANAKSGDEVKSTLDSKLPKSLKALELSQAADSDSLNVTSSFASKNGLSSIADLKKLDSFTLAANPEFKARPDGIPGLKSVYGLDNVKFKAIGDGGGPKTLDALVKDQVQVADIYSTTPSISQNKLVTLKDPKNLFASQQIVPIVTASKATGKIADTLNKVSSTLTTEDLLKLNEQVSGSSKTDPKVAAQNYLKSKSLG